MDNLIHAVHRLDKDTSGVVIFAMNKYAFENIKTLFKKILLKSLQGYCEGVLLVNKPSQ